jgi:hypothetical protein
MTSPHWSSTVVAAGHLHQRPARNGCSGKLDGSGRRIGKEKNAALVQMMSRLTTTTTTTTTSLEITQ